MLLPLYAPAESIVVLRPLGEQLRALAPAVLSQRAVHRFVGYLLAQRRRLLTRGLPGGTSSRPDWWSATDTT